MGIFANMRRNDDDELEGLESSDEWLRDLTSDDDPDMVSLEDLTSPAPPQQAMPASPADLPPPSPSMDGDDANGLWHFPDLDSHDYQQTGSLDLASQVGHEPSPTLSPRTFDFNPEAETSIDEHPELLGFDDRRGQTAPAAWAQQETVEEPAPFEEPISPRFQHFDGPRQSVDPELLAALDLAPDPTWDQVAIAHAQALQGANEEERRGANISYAAIRLLATD